MNERLLVVTDPRELLKRVLRKGRWGLFGFLHSAWSTWRGIDWVYLVYAAAYVVVVYLSQLLVANPDYLTVLAFLGVVGFGVGVLFARKRKPFVRHYTGFLTWLAITLGSITNGQLSRTVIILGQYARYGPRDWIAAVVGIGVFIVLIAFTFRLVEMFRRGDFKVDLSNENSNKKNVDSVGCYHCSVRAIPSE